MKPPQNQQNIPKNRFNLFAVCAHHGTAEKGHYKSYCKNETNKKYEFIDKRQNFPFINANVVIILDGIYTMTSVSKKNKRRKTFWH